MLMYAPTISHLMSLEDDNLDDRSDLQEEARDSVASLRIAWQTTPPELVAADDDCSQLSEVSFDRVSSPSTTFEHDLTTLKHEIAAARHAVKSVQKPTSRFWQRLHVWSERRQRKLAKLRSQRDANDNAECTFKPAVLPRSLELAAKPTISPSSTARARIETLRVELAERELRECTFRPQIVERSRELASSLNRAAMRPVSDAAAPSEPPPTFQPKITSRWKRLQRVREYCNVAAPDRLSRPTPFSHRSHQAQEQKQNRTVIARDQILAFCQRQEASLRAKLQKLDAARQARSAQTTMAPATKKSLENFTMRQEERWKQKLATIAELQNEMENSWAFTPTVDPKSQRLGESSKYRTRIKTAKIGKSEKYHRGHQRDRQRLRELEKSPSSKLVVKSNKVVGTMDDFVFRQRQFEEMKKQRLEERKDRYKNREEDEILEAIKQMQELRLKQLTPQERRLRAKEFAIRNAIIKQHDNAVETESDDDNQNMVKNDLRTDDEEIVEFRLDDGVR